MTDNSKNNSDVEKTVGTLFKGMEGFITTKTVVGEAIRVDDTIILPLADVSFGVGAGAWSGKDKDNGGGGIGGKIQPSAVLVIRNGQSKLVNVKNQDKSTKILDMIPDILEKLENLGKKFKGSGEDTKEEEEETPTEE